MTGWPAAIPDLLRRRLTPGLLSVADQGLVSGFGFLTGIATARLVGLAPFGRFVIVMIFVSLCQNLHNAIATAPMMTLAGASRRPSRAYQGSFLLSATLLAVASGLAMAVLLGCYLWVRGEELSLDFLAAAGLVGAAQNILFTLRRMLFASGRGFHAVAMDSARMVAVPILGAAMHFLHRSITVTDMLWLLGATALLCSLPFVPLFATLRRRTLHIGAVARRHGPQARWLAPVVIVTFGQEQLVWLLAGGILGDTAVGGLRGAQYLVGLVLLLLSATENIIPVSAARAYAEAGRAGMNRYIIATGFKLGLLVAGCLLVIGVPAGFWLKLVFGDAFLPYAGCLRVLALAALAIHVRDMAAHVFRATQRTGVIFRAFAVSGVLSLLVLQPLLAHLGLVGAAVVVLIGHLTSMMYLLVAAARQSEGAPQTWRDGLRSAKAFLGVRPAEAPEARNREA